MSAFRVSAAGLLRLATQGSLADRIAEQVWMSGHGASPSERNSWSRSLSVLAQDLADAGLDDVEVLVEYQLPQGKHGASVGTQHRRHYVMPRAGAQMPRRGTSEFPYCAACSDGVSRQWGRRRRSFKL